MSDDKQGWVQPDLYAQAESVADHLPRTSILKFGKLSEIFINAGKLIGQVLISGLLFALLYIFLLDPAMKDDDQYFLITSEIIKLVCFTISVFLIVRVADDSDIADIGLKLDRHALRDYVAGFAIISIVLGLTFVIYQGLDRVEIESLAWETQTFADVFWNIVVMLLIFVFVGWSEEILSRGFHLRIMSKSLNRPLGVILSSAAFSYLHRDNPGIQPIDFVYIFLFGILMSFAFLRTGQLWLAIGLHTGWDFMATVFLGVPISNLRLFHLADIRVNAFVGAEIIILLVTAVFVYFYTSRHKPMILDW